MNSKRLSYPKSIFDKYDFSTLTKRIRMNEDAYSWKLFRKTYTVSNFEKAIMAIDAKYSAIVYINGKIAKYYLTRTLDFRKSYEVLDVSEFFVEGNNTIVVLTNGYRTESDHDFRIQVEFKSGPRTSEFLCTNKSWKCKVFSELSSNSNFYVPSQGGEEIFDASHFDDSFLNFDFDDSSWENAIEYDNPLYSFTQSNLKEQAYTLSRPKDIVALETFRDVKGYRFHLSPTGRNIVSFFTNIFASKKTTININFTSKSPVLYLDGNSICERMDIEIEEGNHFLAFYIDSPSPSEPEFKIESIEDLEFSSLVDDSKFMIYAVPTLGVEYPWNDPIVAYTIPKEILDALLCTCINDIPDIIKSASIAALEKPLSHEHMIKTYKYVSYEDGIVNDKINDFHARIKSFDKIPINNAANFLKCNGGIKFFSTEEDDGSHIIFDFGIEQIGMLEFSVSAPEGTKIELYGFELISNNGINHMGTKNMLTYICHSGYQTYTSICRRGMRYCGMLISNFKGKVKLHNFVIKDIRYDVNIPEFVSSNEKLNMAYNMSTETASLCMLDSYVDCPGHEQSIWVGDARVSANTNMLLFGEYNFDARFLDQVGQSLIEPFQSVQWSSKLFDSTGRYFTFACYPRYPRGGIPIWSFQWILQTYDNYIYSQNIDTLKTNFDYVLVQLENCFKLTNSRGLLEVQGAWNLIEWSNNDCTMYGELTANQVMLVSCLKVARKEALILGYKDKADLLSKKIEEYTLAINKYCFSEKDRAYVDTVRDEYSYEHYVDFITKKNREPMSYEMYLSQNRISVQTNTLAYLSDIVPKNQIDNVMRFLIRNMEDGKMVKGTPSKRSFGIPTEEEAPSGFVHIGSPFFLYFAYDALCKYGRQDLVLKSIEREFSKIAEYGSNTCWETFTNGNELTRSIAHGWSSSPAIFVAKEILGVKPLEPGFKSFKVSPYTEGLDYASGTVRTPYGDIKVSWRKDDTGFVLSVEHPKEIKYIV